jgi:hypothetical protein
MLCILNESHPRERGRRNMVVIHIRLEQKGAIGGYTDIIEALLSH